MSQNELPSVLMTATLERPENQRLETNILDPTAFSQKQVRFVFPPTGILASDSQLHLAQTVTNSLVPGVDTNSFYPTSTGALAMIQRAYLTIGGKRVSDLQSVGAYNTWKRLHFSNDYRERVAMPKQAGNDVFMGSASKTIADDSASAILSRGFDPPYGTLGRRSSEYASVFNSDTDTGLQVEERTSTSDKGKRLITADPSTTPGFMISLNQLVPALKGVNLPLFAIKEEVALVIEFSPNTIRNRFMWAAKAADGTDLTVNDASGKPKYESSVSTIVQDQCYILADYLYYTDLMTQMEDVIMNRGGYNLPFDDLIVQSNAVNVAVGSFTQEFQIPLGGKKVKSIVVQKEVPTANINSAKYNSTEWRNGTEYQVKIDSSNFYSLPIKNRALQKTEADQIEGVPLVINDYQYTYKNQTQDSTSGIIGANDYGITDRLCNTHAQNVEAGTQHWTGVKLSNAFEEGIRISNQPIIWTEQGTATAPDIKTRTYRFFCTIQKILNISGGLALTIE